MARSFSYSVPWNLFLITLGAALIALAVKAIVLPHGFISGGFAGAGLLLYYLSGKLSPGIWFLALNVPVFILGWLFVSRRFFFYSLYGMLAVTLFLEVINVSFPIREPILAALAAGTVMGAGAGLALRTLGSTGGTDIIAVILYQRWNLPVGKVSFGFNMSVFVSALVFLDTDLVLYSLALVFIQSQVMEYVLGLFNERKLVLIISEHVDAIAETITHRLHRGATVLYGRGAFTGRRKRVLMTIINNIQLKRLEEIVFSHDPDAFTIVTNTLTVLGRGFSARKRY